MKRVVFCLLFLCPLVAEADEFPARKAGLWEMSTSMDGQPAGPPMKQCIDAKTDKAMMKVGKDMAQSMGNNCSKNDFRKEGSNFVTEMDCNMGATRMTSKTIFSGDFNSKYTSTTTTKFDPPMMGMAGNKSVITAKWLGACEAGQKPGDIIMPNGMKMDLGAMGKMAEAAQAGAPAVGQ